MLKPLIVILATIFMLSLLSACNLMTRCGVPQLENTQTSSYTGYTMTKHLVDSVGGGLANGYIGRNMTH